MRCYSRELSGFIYKLDGIQTFLPKRKNCVTRNRYDFNTRSTRFERVTICNSQWLLTMRFTDVHLILLYYSDALYYKDIMARSCTIHACIARLQRKKRKSLSALLAACAILIFKLLEWCVRFPVYLEIALLVCPLNN